MRSRVTPKIWPTSSSVWVLAVVHAEAQAQHVCLTLGQRAEDLAAAPRPAACWLVASAGPGVLSSSTKEPMVVSSSSPTGVSSDSVSAAVRLASMIFSIGRFSSCGDLLQRRLAAQLLHQLAVAARGLVDDLHHMHRHADGPCLIGNGAGNRLPDPPGRICREFVSLCIVELVHRADQARVALLNEVEDMQAAAGILLRNGDDQAQVRLGQLVLGLLIALGDAAWPDPCSSSAVSSGT